MVPTTIPLFLLRNRGTGCIRRADFSEQNPEKEWFHADLKARTESSLQRGELRPAEKGPGTAEVVPEFEFDVGVGGDGVMVDGAGDEGAEIMLVGEFGQVVRCLSFVHGENHGFDELHPVLAPVESSFVALALSICPDRFGDPETGYAGCSALYGEVGGDFQCLALGFAFEVAGFDRFDNVLAERTLLRCLKERFLRTNILPFDPICSE